MNTGITSAKPASAAPMCGRLACRAQAGVERGLVVEPAQHREQREGEREAHREQARDVAAREVAELVREHRLDLARA